MTEPDPWTARIDWPKLLEDVAYLLGEPSQANPDLRIAVSQEKLATALDVSRGTLRNWMDGSEPRHSDGETLLFRWCSLSGKARTFAPVTHFAYISAQWERRQAREASRPAPPASSGPSLESVWRGEEHGKACLTLVGDS